MTTNGWTQISFNRIYTTSLPYSNLAVKMDEVKLNTEFSVTIVDVDDGKNEIETTKTNIKLRFYSSSTALEVLNNCFNEPRLLFDRRPGVWDFDLSDSASMKIRYEGSQILEYTYTENCSAKKLATTLKHVEFHVTNTGANDIEETFRAWFKPLLIRKYQVVSTRDKKLCSYYAGLSFLPLLQ